MHFLIMLTFFMNTLFFLGNKLYKKPANCMATLPLPGR